MRNTVVALAGPPHRLTMSKLEIIGVPTTLLIDRKGREVARYTGVAEWARLEVTNTIERYLRNPN